MNIIGFIDRKIETRFTGDLKFSFENSKLQTITEANQIDVPFTPKEMCANDFNSILQSIGFNGSIVLRFNNGKILAFAYQRTYKCASLNNLLN